MLLVGVGGLSKLVVEGHPAEGLWSLLTVTSLTCGGPEDHRSAAAVVGGNHDYPIIRIDTNQGVHGLGEVRDAGHQENVLQFATMLLDQNPCDVDVIFRRTIGRTGTSAYRKPEGLASN